MVYNPKKHYKDTKALFLSMYTIPLIVKLLNIYLFAHIIYI